MTQRSDGSRGTASGIALGLLAAIVVAVVYGVLAEPFELTLGLIVVAFAGGWLIGNALAYGTWRGDEHSRRASLQWAAVALAVVAWIGALVIAYVVSQALIQGSATSLSSRLSASGFFDYFLGLDIVRFIHLIALAVMGFMAWRGAR